MTEAHNTPTGRQLPRRQREEQSELSSFAIVDPLLLECLFYRLQEGGQGGGQESRVSYRFLQSLIPYCLNVFSTVFRKEAKEEAKKAE